MRARAHIAKGKTLPLTETKHAKRTGRKVLVLHTSGYGKYLGHLNIVFDSSGEVRSFNGDPIVLDHSRKEDPELRTIVDQYQEEIDKKMNVAIGRAVSYIDGGRPGCRLYECAFGDLATDAMAAEMNVGMAILNSGGIKGSFNAGEYAIPIRLLEDRLWVNE